jgi:hypothetical protein
VQETAEQIASVDSGRLIVADGSQSRTERWGLKRQRPMRAMGVVVRDVDPKGLLEVAAPTISSQSRHSARTVCTQRSAYAFALGARTGVTSTSPPSAQNTASKLRQNLASRSRSTKRTCRPPSPSTSSKLRACWATQAPLGLAVTPAKWTRRVSSSMKNSTYSRRSHRIDGEEVAGHDPGGLLAQELPPGGGRGPRCRIHPVTLQRRADHRRRDPHAQAQQLALNALVAPARVLPGQTDDQLLHLLVQRWPADPVWVGPRAGNQAPMPAQQRLWRHEEARPAGAGQHPADGGEQRPIGGLQPGTRGLAAQHRELVAQHQDLQVVGGVAAGQQHQQLDGATQRQVGSFDSTR